MKWLIDGADRETGESRSIVIGASSREDAQKRASRAGIVVSFCEPVPGQSAARDELLSLGGAIAGIALIGLAILPETDGATGEARRALLSGAGSFGALLAGSILLVCSTALYIAHRSRHD